MTVARLPAMSVVIVAPGGFEPILQLIHHLAAQNVRDRLELVIVAPSADAVRRHEQDLSVFHSWKVVEVDPNSVATDARAAGVWQAGAPVIAFAEDHSYPQPGWAEALLNAHQGPWAVVGPAMVNGNPASGTSWANFLIEYGQWMWPGQPGEREHLPGHNSSYKRAVLLAYGKRLSAMLEAESVLHWNLRAQGCRLYLEPAARTHHLNPSRLWAWLPNRFRAGRSFAGPRARLWPVWRRLFYAAGALLLPVRGGLQILRLIRRAGLTGRLVPRVLPALLVILVIDGLGRAAGYTLGYRHRAVDDRTLEFDRHDFMTEHDRRAEAHRRPAEPQ